MKYTLKKKKSNSKKEGGKEGGGKEGGVTTLGFIHASMCDAEDICPQHLSIYSQL